MWGCALRVSQEGAGEAGVGCSPSAQPAEPGREQWESGEGAGVKFAAAAVKFAAVSRKPHFPSEKRVGSVAWGFALAQEGSSLLGRHFLLDSRRL